MCRSPLPVARVVVLIGGLLLSGALWADEGQGFGKCFSPTFGFVFFHPASWKVKTGPLSAFSTVEAARADRCNWFELRVPRDDQPGKKQPDAAVKISLFEGFPPDLEESEIAALKSRGSTEHETEEEPFADDFALEIFLHQAGRTCRIYAPPPHQPLREGLVQIVRSFRFLSPSERTFGEQVAAPEPLSARFLQEKADHPVLFGRLGIGQRAYVEGLCRRIEANPLHFQAFRDLGNLYLAVGGRDEGQRLLETARKIRPDDFGTNYSLGFCAREKKKTAQALEYFLWAADQDEGHQGVHQQIGELLLETGKFRDALRHFGIASEPTSMALCHIGLGHRKEALARFQELLPVDKREAMDLLGKIEEKFGEVFPSEPFHQTPTDVWNREGPAAIRALLERLAQHSHRSKEPGRKQIHIKNGFIEFGSYYLSTLPTRIKAQIHPEARTVLETFGRECVATGPLSFPPFNSPFDECRIEPQVVHDLFSARTGGGWTEFYRRYPASVGLVGFSRPAFNQAHDRCLIYQEYSWDGLAGSGVLYFLRKTGQAWEIADALGMWIS